MTLSIPRIVYALARDGFLPRALSRVHPIYRSPQLAIITQSILTLALAITGTFEQLAIIANVVGAGALSRLRGRRMEAWTITDCSSPRMRRDRVAADRPDDRTSGSPSARLVVASIVYLPDRSTD